MSKEKQKSDIDLKTSTVNLALNTVIFLLCALIVYLSFSIYIKLWGNKPEEKNKGKQQVAADLIQVDILNGCGIKGTAERFTEYLRNNNFDVVSVGNYKSFDIENTLVIDRIGNMANAKKIAESLGIKEKNIIQQINEEYFLDVSIIIGKDYHSLKPLK